MSHPHCHRCQRALTRPTWVRARRIWPVLLLLVAAVHFGLGLSLMPHLQRTQPYLQVILFVAALGLYARRYQVPGCPGCRSVRNTWFHVVVDVPEVDQGPGR